MSEEDWTIVAKTKKNWDDEEDEDLKENWDDEDEEEVSQASSVAGEASEKPSEAKIKPAQGKSKRKALKEKLAQREAEETRPKTAEELLAQKLEQQRLVEESDLDLAKDTFGVSTGSDASILDNIRLASKEDFEEFRKALEQKLSPFVRSPYYASFLEDLFRNLSTSLDTEDIKKINHALNSLYNEKIKLQKQQTKGKKKDKKNVELRVERDSDYNYNQLDDYEDFL